MANIADDPKVQALLEKQTKQHEKALAAAAKAGATSTKAAYKAAVAAVKSVFADALDDVKGDKVATNALKAIQKGAVDAINAAQLETDE